MSLAELLEPRGQRKLLSIDGGGIRGVLALEILRKVESTLRQRTGNSSFVMADYFDFIGGTSTGAIVAIGLARGMEVQEILDFYLRWEGTAREDNDATGDFQELARQAGFEERIVLTR